MEIIVHLKSVFDLRLIYQDNIKNNIKLTLHLFSFSLKKARLVQDYLLLFNVSECTCQCLICQVRKFNMEFIRISR